MRKPGLLAVALFFAACGSALGAGITECTQYSNEAVATAHEVRNLNCGFDLSHPQWSTNREAHMRWCRNAEASSVEHELNARRRSIRFCRVCRAYSNAAVAAALDNERLQCGKSGPDWSTDPASHFNWCMGLEDNYVRGAGFSATHEPEGGFSREYLEPTTGDRTMKIERCKIRTTKQPLQAARPYSPREKSGASKSSSAAKAHNPESLKRKRSGKEADVARVPCGAPGSKPCASPVRATTPGLLDSSSPLGGGGSATPAGAPVAPRAPAARP